MKPSIISSFAAGLLLAAAVSSVAYFVTKEDAPKAAETTATNTPATEENSEGVETTPTVEEMQDILSSSGYVVQTKEAAEKAESDWQKKVDAAEEKASETESNGDVVFRTSIYVSNGMTSIDVGNALKDADIIKMSGFEFSKEVEKKGVEKYLKPGSYKIDSSMSTNKIISTIFQKQ
ncbi:aminodeoxychorismate lyase [Niallia circulans]|uniref:Aminodeoxychorismate lyase n=1 Tax=Niallia circulans TaxID=1397 RepID=A0A553SMI6_NIACI|nr:aminodeoxychorismate lyase [Niallia circulans]TRZ38201.1 aminodeoxychorismate lyase [Niallia circulans]